MACLSFQGLDDGVPDGGTTTEAGSDVTAPNCDADLESDPTNCGACGRICPPQANGLPLCSAGECAVACNSGFANCDNNDSNGCETPIRASSTNCGACGRDCGGTTCNDGQCAPQVLAGKQANPLTLAVDTNNVYWGAAGDGTIDKIAKTGGSSTPISQGEATPVAIALDATTIYWVDRGNGPGTGLVRRAALAGGAPSTLVGGLSNRPNAIAVDAMHVYYATIGAGLPTDGAVYSVPLGTADAGAGAIIASQQNTPMLMTADAQNVYWTNSGSAVADAGAPNGSVMRCASPSCAGGPQAFATGQNHPRGIAVYAQNVYWTNFGTGQNDGAVMMCPKTGCGTAPTVLAPNLVSPDGIAVDANYVYFAAHSGAVQRIALSGGTPETVATVAGPSYPLAVAVDDKFVFFSTYSSSGDGTIQMVRK